MNEDTKRKIIMLTFLFLLVWRTGGGPEGMGVPFGAIGFTGAFGRDTFFRLFCTEGAVEKRICTSGSSGGGVWRIGEGGSSTGPLEI